LVPQVSQSFWAGVDDEKINIDKIEIEGMFAATAISPKPSMGGGSKPILGKPKNMLITLIDMKRANNCGTHNFNHKFSSRVEACKRPF
jgi:hypothetical protein